MTRTSGSHGRDFRGLMVGVILFLCILVWAGLSFRSGDQGAGPSPSSGASPSPSGDPEEEFAHQLGVDAMTVNNHLPGYTSEDMGAMRVDGGVFYTGEFTYELTAADSTVLVYLEGEEHCVEVSAVGPDSATITSSHDSRDIWTGNMPKFGLPCDDFYQGVEPFEMYWQNPIGLEGWEELISVPGECLKLVESVYGPVDDRVMVPRVVSCDDDWDMILVSKGFIDAGENPTEDELIAIADEHCSADIADYKASHDVPDYLYSNWYYPTEQGYQMGFTTYVCILEVQNPGVEN